jgi:hypothetical protein
VEERHVVAPAARSERVERGPRGRCPSFRFHAAPRSRSRRRG